MYLPPQFASITTNLSEGKAYDVHKDASPQLACITTILSTKPLCTYIHISTACMKLNKPIRNLYVPTSTDSMYHNHLWVQNPCVQTYVSPQFVCILTIRSKTFVYIPPQLACLTTNPSQGKAFIYTYRHISTVCINFHKPISQISKTCSSNSTVCMYSKKHLWELEVHVYFEYLHSYHQIPVNPS